MALAAIGVVYHPGLAMAQLGAEPDGRQALDWVRLQVQPCAHWPTPGEGIAAGYESPADSLRPPHRTLMLGWAGA